MMAKILRTNAVHVPQPLIPCPISGTLDCLDTRVCCHTPQSSPSIQQTGYTKMRYPLPNRSVPCPVERNRAPGTFRTTCEKAVRFVIRQSQILRSGDASKIDGETPDGR